MGMNMGFFLEFGTVDATCNVKVICPSFAQSGVEVQHTFKVLYACRRCSDDNAVHCFFSLIGIAVCCHVSVSMCLSSSYRYN